MSAEIQPLSIFTAHQRLLRERFYYLIDSLHPLLRADVVCALEEPGKLLSRSYEDTSNTSPLLPSGAWSLLTLLIAQHVSPGIDPLYASNIAIATECFLCALDLLDDVEDGDQTKVIQILGSARALNVSTALLAIAQQAILSASHYNIPLKRIIHMLNILQNASLVATNGQHRDILAEQRTEQEFSIEECLEIAAAKAGSLMRFACLLGAVCADAEKQVCEEFSELGEVLGIAHQLDNDCHDLYHHLYSDFSLVHPRGNEAFEGTRKTDLTRGKKTLPIILAAKRGYSLQKLQSLAGEEDNKECLQALQEGILSSRGICLLYRERARESLQKIEAHQPISPALRLLLNSTY